MASSRDPLLGAAAMAAAIVLLVSPFKSSAGIRGGLLVIAAALVIAHCVGRDRRPMGGDIGRGILYALFAYVAYASLAALVAPDPLDALSIVKRDMLAPALAGAVFFVLTQTRADLLRWAGFLAVGLVGLAWLAVRDPFDPSTMMQDPGYGHVGRLTTWLVLCVPLVTLLAFAPRRRRGLAWGLMAISVAMIAVAAWMTANRMVWICFATMLLCAIVLSLLFARRAVRRGAMFAAGFTLVAIAVTLAATMDYRARTQSSQGQGRVEFLLQDHRLPIWRAAGELIAERPWAGHGWNDDLVAARLAERLPDDPWLKTYVRQAHNMTLNAALQWGIPGALLQLVLYATLLATFLRAARAPGRANALVSIAGIAGVALVVGYVLRNMVDDFTSRHLSLMFGAAVGILLGLARGGPAFSAPREH